MTLSKRILLFIFLVTVVAVGIIIIIFRSVMLERFEKVELDLMDRNKIRVEKALTERIAAISFYNRDWAFWDDTYEFIVDKNQQYIDDNLSINTTFESGKLNLIIFLNNDNNVVYSSGFDLSNKTRTPLPDGLENYLKKDSALVTHNSYNSEVNGIVVLPFGIYLLSSYPILNNDAQGPVHGSLIMGRQLEQKELTSLSETTELDLRILKPNEGQQNTNQDVMFGYVKIKDVHGEDGFVIEVKRPRDVYQQGIAAVNLIAIFIICSAIIFLFVFYYFIGRNVLLPISKLSQEVKKMGASGDFTKRVQISGTQEIVGLGADINQMLASLEKLKIAAESGREDLADKLKELQNAKLAMLNLLEDAKELEGILRTEKDQAQAIISSMGEGLLVIDTNYRIKLINKAAQTMLDVTETEAVGADWSKVVQVYHGGTQATLSYRSFYKSIMERKTFVTGITDGHYYHTIKGKVFPVASVTSPLYSGNEVIGAIKVFRDATNEKEEKSRIEKIVEERTHELRDKNNALQKAQEQITEGWIKLQDEKARLTSSINSLSLGFILTDIDENVLIINPAAEKILKTDKPISNFSEIEAFFKDSIDLHKLHSELKSVSEEITNGVSTIRLLLAPIISNAKGVDEKIGTVVLLDDITEAKVLERSKDEFFSIASHELRTPLTSIRGNTSMILDYFLQDLKDPSLKEMIDDIHESSVRLIGIVNDFLDLSRLEQKRIEFKKEDIDIVDLSKEVLSELKANANGHIELKLLLPNTMPPHILADRNKVKEILINLVGNALKFTESGSVSIRFETHEKQLEIFIVDTGRGIPLVNQNLLFRKFQQAGDSLFTRDTTKGTGLGLYISKLMVEGMGGVIKLVESVPGKGTTFSFTLPLAA